MRIALLSLLLTAVVAAPAPAASLSYSVANSVYLLKGGSAGERLVVGTSGGDLAFTGTGLVATSTATGAGECHASGTDGADASFVCSALAIRVIVRGNGGADDIGAVLGNSGITIPLRLFGGPGNDTVTGGPMNDVIEGDEGNDLMRGGLGADSVAGDCNTGIACKNGNDTLDLSMDGRTGGARADLTSGPDPADISRGVENLIGTDGDDLLTGGPGANRIEGRGGDDTIDVRDMSADVADCGDGQDRVAADSSDTLTACESPDVQPRPVVAKAGRLRAGDPRLKDRRLVLDGFAKCSPGGGRCTLRINVAGIGFEKRRVAAGARVKLVDPLTARVARVLRNSDPQRAHITVLLSRPGVATVKREYDATIRV